MQHINTYDLAIAGGGSVGMTLALAVKSALKNACTVAVFDPNGFEPRAHDLRASAIAAQTRTLYENLGVWQNLEAEAQPINEMIITDTALEEPVRPPILSFGEKATSQPFAHMVANNALSVVLKNAALDAGVVLINKPVLSYKMDSNQVQLNHGDAQYSTAKLLVGADGARSALREQAGIAFYGWGYGQMALVATIGHERPHFGRAIEHFLPSGPFALLPLKGNRSSIVWTEPEAEASRFMAMDETSLLRELERRFGLELGALTLLTPLESWPLKLGLARRFIATRLALIGDAAHIIHPIAGQGLNLGLKDAAALSERIVVQARLGLDIGDSHVLEAYQRDRRFDTSAMAVTTDVLNRLFSSDSKPLRAIRGFGLGMVEKMPKLKKFFIGQAAGKVMS